MVSLKDIWFCFNMAVSQPQAPNALPCFTPPAETVSDISTEPYAGDVSRGAEIAFGALAVAAAAAYARHRRRPRTVFTLSGDFVRDADGEISHYRLENLPKVVVKWKN